jgi:hypothetical protein
MSIPRVLFTAALFALLLLGIGCGSQSSGRPTGTASLALQSKAPVWGGDTQPAATDVVRVGITQQQAKEIAQACRDAPAELPSSGTGTCEDKIQKVIRLVHPPCARKLCLVVARTTPGQMAQPDGFVKIVDEQPGTPLCRSGPEHQCFRLGVQAPVLQTLASATPVTLSPAPTPTASSPTPTASSPTPTVSTSPAPTVSSPAPNVSTSSIMPNPAKSEASLPAGLGS